MTTSKKTSVNQDIDAIVPEPESLTLSDGFEIDVNRLRTRETMKLMKIITRGVSGSIGSILFSEDDSEESFIGALLGATIVAIPEAENETIEFIRAMVVPSKLIESPRTKPERESNDEQFEKLHRLLENPELEDLVTILEQVIRNEGPQIRALGNRLALLLKVQTSSAEAKQGGSSKSESAS